jgi:hypothetical protein
VKRECKIVDHSGIPASAYQHLNFDDANEQHHSLHQLPEDRNRPKNDEPFKV